MPLETATYISQLNSANPAHTDQINQDDSHARLIKSTILATFPNFTAAALTSTQAQIDAGVASDTNGQSKLADAGAFFKTNTTDGFTNPAAGEVGINTAGSKRLSVTAASIAPAGTTVFSGPGAFPIGASSPWFSDTLPSGFGTFAWLNGQAISRTTYAAVFAILGTAFGVGDGTTTFNLPDTRDNVLVGKGTMGATSAAGRITNFVTSTLGNLFGECLHLLGIGEIPSHNHTLTDPGHTHTTTPAVPVVIQNAGGGSYFTASTQTTANLAINNAMTGISIAAAGGGGTHNNVQPSLVCNWVMRIL